MSGSTENWTKARLRQEVSELEAKLAQAVVERRLWERTARRAEQRAYSTEIVARAVLIAIGAVGVAGFALKLWW